MKIYSILKSDKYKKIKTQQLNQNDLIKVTDGEFLDSYNNIVKHGDTIIIESHYSFTHLENREALVEWNPSRGMYNFVLADDTRFKSREDFYGVHSFKLISCLHLNVTKSRDGNNEYSTVCNDCKKTIYE